MTCLSTHKARPVAGPWDRVRQIRLELEMGATRDRESEKRTNADGDALDQTHVLLLPTIRGEGLSPRSQPISATPFEGTCWHMIGGHPKRGQAGGSPYGDSRRVGGVLESY